MALKGDGGYWWIYLTHWGLTLEVVYFGLATYTTYMSDKWPEKPAEGPEPIPAYVKWMWVLNGIMLPGSFLIFLMYWGFVFSAGAGALRILSMLTHGYNFLAMAVDSAVSSTPYLLLHGIYFLGFATIYLAWTLLHYAVGLTNQDGERYIYAAIDWNNP